MKQLSLLICLCSCAIISMAQGYKQRLYNFCPDTSITSGNAAQYAEDSFFIAAGITTLDTDKSNCVYISRFDYDLNMLKKKYLKFAGKYSIIYNSYHALTKLSDNKYVVAGYNQDYTINSRVSVSQPFLHIFNKELDSITYHSYIDTVQLRLPTSIIVDKQKNIIVTGIITSTTLILNSGDHKWYPDSSYVWVAKFDSNANQLWSKQYFGMQNASDWGYSITMSHDSDAYMVGGACYNISTARLENFIAKLDTNGNVIWRKFIYTPLFSFRNHFDLIPSSTGSGYYFNATYTDSIIHYSGGYDGPGNSFFYYGKVNESGDTLWTKKFRWFLYWSWCEGEKITQTANGDLLLLGTWADYATIPAILRTDSNGNFIWYKEYKRDHIDTNTNPQCYLNSINIVQNNRILLSGQVSGGKNGFFDTTGSLSWFVLTDSLGCMDPDCNLAVPTSNKTMINNIKVYPNPVTSTFEIQGAIGYSYTITDIRGSTIAAGKLQQDKTSFNIESYSPGIYIIDLVDQSDQQHVRIIKQ